MFFFPAGCLIFSLFILFFPVILLLLFFNVVTFSFERLGVSPQVALIVLFATLVGSIINIPLTRGNVKPSRNRRFGWFEMPVQQEPRLAINLGGAIIPTAFSCYLLTKVPLLPAIVSTVLMIVICKFLTKPVPGRGLAIPMFIPPLCATLFAVLFAGEFAAPVAYISGVLGTLIGGDLLNLGKAKKLGAGVISIGGAGVFDGIFLVGVFSVALTAIFIPYSPLQLPVI